MRRDLWGSIVYEASDFKDFVTNDLNSKKKYKVNYNDKLTHSISTDNKLPKTGIYAIYRNDLLVYIGCTSWSIHGRIARFVAGVRGTERDDESHPAAYKYIEHFGDDVENLYVSFCSIDPENLPDNILMTDIEEVAIVSMCPLFNEQTYDMYKFEKRAIIVNLKTGIEQYA